MSKTTNSRLNATVAALLRDAVSRIWHRFQDNIAAAHAALHHRAECNSLAVQGRCPPRAEREGARAKGTA